MGSLRKCLQDFGASISDADKKALLDANAQFVKDGFRGDQPGILAVQSAMDEVEAEYLDIAKQLGLGQAELFPKDEVAQATEDAKPKPPSETQPGMGAGPGGLFTEESKQADIEDVTKLQIGDRVRVKSEGTGQHMLHGFRGEIKGFFDAGFVDVLIDDAGRKRSFQGWRGQIAADFLVKEQQKPAIEDVEEYSYELDIDALVKLTQGAATVEQAKAALEDGGRMIPTAFQWLQDFKPGESYAKEFKRILAAGWVKGPGLPVPVIPEKITTAPTAEEQREAEVEAFRERLIHMNEGQLSATVNELKTSDPELSALAARSLQYRQAADKAAGDVRTVLLDKTLLRNTAVNQPDNYRPAVERAIGRAIMNMTTEAKGDAVMLHGLEQLMESDKSAQRRKTTPSSKFFDNDWYDALKAEHLKEHERIEKAKADAPGKKMESTH
jgi:hypothetical protein